MKNQLTPKKSLLKEELIHLLKMFTVGGSAREKNFRAMTSFQTTDVQPAGFAVHEVAKFLKQQGYLADITVTCKKGSRELDVMITLLKNNDYASLLNQVKQELNHARDRERFLLASPRPSSSQPSFFVSSQGQDVLAQPVAKRHSK